MVNCQLRNDFKGRARKMGVFEGGGWGGGGGGGRLTWPLILRIFRMVSITFLFCHPLDYKLTIIGFKSNSLAFTTSTVHTDKC